MFKESYPGVAEWTEGWGWMEIGQDEHSRSMVRVLDEGGLVWESPDTVKSLDKALAAAERFISRWIEENG